MAYQVVWATKASETYLDNIRYLEQNWTEKEASKFASTVENKLTLIAQQPEIGRSGNKKYRDIRRIVIHKRVSLIYRIKKRQMKIELLSAFA